jgi:hypothetical protein
VTTNHPFYVDSGPGIVTSAWVHAGDLRVGDRIRTESGRDVTVVGLRYHAGQAHVYTLTVATDHDFFVGSAGVLVHNAICPIHIHNTLEDELLSKGVHIDTAGVELSVLPGQGGDIVFKAVSDSRYSSDAVKAATKIAVAGLEDPAIVSRLLAVAQHSLTLAQASSNPEIRASAAEYAFLVKDLRALGAK